MYYLSRTIFQFFFVVVMATGSAWADTEELREKFVQAEKALDKGNDKKYRTLKAQLKDYPLLPYLDYQELLRDLSKVSLSQARQFINENKGTVLGYRFKRKWLSYLGQKKRWNNFIAFYTPQSSISLQCYQLNSLIHTGKAKQAMPKVKDIWLHGKSQPKSCDPVFKAWEKAGHLTTNLRWQRIELAMKKKNWRLARFIGRGLPLEEKEWINKWIQLHRTPSMALKTNNFNKPHKYREAMLTHGLRRLAYIDANEAKLAWQAVTQRYPFSTEQRKAIDRRLVFAMFRREESDAYGFLKTVEPCNKDTRLQEARIRAGLLHRDWRNVLDWINALPEDRRDNERWRYWKAMSLLALNNKDRAKKLFSDLAKNRSYYGFLAADRIGAQYNLNHADTPIDDTAIQAIAKKPALQRATELFALERPINAKREWHWGTRKFDKKQLKAAAKHAQSIGWLDQSIFTLAKTGYWEDLELRFPVEHRSLVEENAQRHQIDTVWIYAVMRQESAFNQRAKSHAGARGLMQLMPATARNVARRQLKQKKAPSKSALFVPKTNIALGSAYLKAMLDKWNNPVLATASYNAGPHRVEAWLPKRGLPADIWVELIPFKETRGYVRAVMAYSVIYGKRLGLDSGRMKDRMPNVLQADQLLAQSQKKDGKS